MAQGNLAACLKITLAHEGGYTNDKRDPGNWTGGKVGVGTLKGTKYGVSAASYPSLDIKGLTLDDVRPIYERNYWKPLKGDALPAGVDMGTFDFGVNSGNSRSARTLQAVLGVKADGVIGPVTLKAAVLADGKALIQRLCAKRLGFLQGLKTWATFKRGWSRRVADVEAKAVAMWLASRGMKAQARADELEAEARKANTKATTQNSGAGTAASGGVAAGGGDAVISGEPNWMLIAGIAALVIVAATVLVIKARQNKERAAAYREAAQSAS